MTQSVDQNTIILNKFHQLSLAQQQQIIDFIDFLLLKKERKDETLNRIKGKPTLSGTQPFELFGTPEESGIPIDEWEMEHDYS